MNTKWRRLATILWIWSVVLATWVGVYAAKNDASLSEAMDKDRHPMIMEKQLWSGEMKLPPKMNLSGEDKMPKGWKENRFWFAFIDEESLTDNQKAEIEKLQEERDEAIKKINDDFFDKLEKFISEEKLEDYENLKWMERKKGEHQMKWDNPMKNIQKPKGTDEE